MTQDVLRNTEDWFKKALPDPTDKDLSTQYSVFLEEVMETLDSVYMSSGSHGVEKHAKLVITKLKSDVNFLIDLLRSGRITLVVKDRTEFLDGLADTVVTAQATAHAAGMDLPGALDEVNKSNFSKFVDGEPIFIEGTRKIGKGPNYFKPNLEPFV